MARQQAADLTLIRELSESTVCVGLLHVGVRSGGAGARSLDEGQAVHLHGADDSLLRLGSLRTDRCWLRHPGSRFTRLSVHVQRTRSAALCRTRLSHSSP